VIGDQTTHGKGTVQNLMDVAAREPFRFFKGTDRGKLKLTIQQFYRVNGDSTQNRGVTSDVVLPSLLDHIDEGESSLDNALPFDHIDPARYSASRLVSAEVVAALQKQSEQRVATVDDFQKVEKLIRQYLERKNKKSVSLNEAVLKAERDLEKEAAKDNPKDPDEIKAKDPNEPVFPKGFYNDEILNVALDYVQAFPALAAATRRP
jgi:carboxyl-terminal processing protease